MYLKKTASIKFPRKYQAFDDQFARVQVTQ